MTKIVLKKPNPKKQNASNKPITAPHISGRCSCKILFIFASFIERVSRAYQSFDS